VRRQATGARAAAILRYQDRLPDPVQAGMELGVDAVLAAAFERVGDQLRVAARLVAAADGRTLWATEIAAPLADMFGLLDTISDSVARALQPEASPGSAPRTAGARPPAMPAAAVWELCLKGRVHLLRDTMVDCIAAVDCFDKARAADRGYAPAWAGLADAYARLAFDHQPEGDWYRRAEEMCDQAMRIDPILPEGRYVRARLLWSPQAGFDHAGALREAGAALAADPTLLEARMKVGGVLMHVGMLAESERQYREILGLSPGHAAAEGAMGLCLYYRARFDDAHDLTAAAARGTPAFWLSYQLALCQLQLGRHDEAERTAGHMHPVRGLLAALRGDAFEARREARVVAETLKPYGHFHHAQYDIACIHALLSGAEEALRWLAAAACNGFPCAPFFAADPLLANLRGEPRFQRLLDELAEERSRYARVYAELPAA